VLFRSQTHQFSDTPLKQWILNNNIYTQETTNPQFQAI